MARERSSWLVGPLSGQEHEILDEFVARVQADPEVRVVRSIEPSDQPHLVVVEMSDETSNRYLHEYRQSLRFERNQSLDVFTPMNQ